MSSISIYFVLLIVNLINIVFGYASYGNIRCGTYGFICEGISKVRLCDGDKLVGPSFICPSNTICNEESIDVCESSMNFIDTSITRAVRCYRSERIADTSVPDCKGYILCIPNKNRFQGIKFKCSGNTIFNGYTRACTSPDKYKCPLANSTKTNTQYFGESNRKVFSSQDVGFQGSSGHRPIDCKNYKLSVTQDNSPVRAAYFCPSKPAAGESFIRCTVFSNHFCMTLERDVEDQFIQNVGAAYRRPRQQIIKDNV